MYENRDWRESRDVRVEREGSEDRHGGEGRKSEKEARVEGGRSDEERGPRC